MMLEIIQNIFSKIILIIVTPILIFFGIQDVKLSDQYIENEFVIESEIDLNDLSITIEKDDVLPEEIIEENKTNSITEDIVDIEIILQEEVIKKITILTPTISTEKLNKDVREAVVNVFCTSKNGNLLEPITGSGVFIDPQGIILTNAHVAQYFLLEKYVNCIIRKDSPAQPFYNAKLLYISSVWVDNNTSNLKEENPLSTGESDYALLKVTSSARVGESLPTAFPYISPFPIIENISRGTTILLASYPAGFLGGITISRDLWLSSSIAIVNDIFTFTEDGEGVKKLDLFSVDGTIGAQGGSSGGASVSTVDGRLLGIITTRTEGETTGERTLRLLTIRHIDEKIKEETGESLQEFLNDNLMEKTLKFNKDIFPILSKKLTDSLP